MANRKKTSRGSTSSHRSTSNRSRHGNEGVIEWLEEMFTTAPKRGKKASSSKSRTTSHRSARSHARSRAYEIEETPSRSRRGHSSARSVAAGRRERNELGQFISAHSSSRSTSHRRKTASHKSSAKKAHTRGKTAHRGTKSSHARSKTSHRGSRSY